MCDRTPRARCPEDPRLAPHPQDTADDETQEGHLAAWQQWLFEEALGSSPAPVHLPRCLLRRLWACTVSDRATTPREP